MIPYGRQWIDEEDIAAVIDVLRSAWITTGPKVQAFEQAICDFTGADYAVSVSSGTAALHSAMFAAGIGPGDEVLVPAITFVATANAAVFQGGVPVFVDVDPLTLLIDVSKVESKISPRTKAIVAVDYAGHPCDYETLRMIADRHNLILIADACHALGAARKDKKVGTLADLNVFSFHAVKPITTGEGGMVATDSPELAARLRIFRNHGITTDHWQREQQESWAYEMVDLGYNYRLTDFQCALGIRQLQKLPAWTARRQQIAKLYDTAFSKFPEIQPLLVLPNISHSYHLYVIQLDLLTLSVNRETIFKELRRKEIGVNVHYIPVHLLPFYRTRFNTKTGLCPTAEAAYQQILSLPIFPGMIDSDIEHVIDSVNKVIKDHRK